MPSEFARKVMDEYVEDVFTSGITYIPEKLGYWQFRFGSWIFFFYEIHNEEQCSCAPIFKLSDRIQKTKDFYYGVIKYYHRSYNSHKIFVILSDCAIVEDKKSDKIPYNITEEPYNYSTKVNSIVTAYFDFKHIEECDITVYPYSVTPSRIIIREQPVSTPMVVKTPMVENVMVSFTNIILEKISNSQLKKDDLPHLLSEATKIYPSIFELSLTAKA
jgi:hypothetical protein